jgi:hypothetical protein
MLTMVYALRHRNKILLLQKKNIVNLAKGNIKNRVIQITYNFCVMLYSSFDCPQLIIMHQHLLSPESYVLHFEVAFLITGSFKSHAWFKLRIAPL